MKIIENTENSEVIRQLVRAQSSEDISSRVEEIISIVKNEGDKAICELTARFDGIETSKPQIMYRGELGQYVNENIGLLSEQQIKAIDVAIENVTFTASRSMPKSWRDTAPGGHTIGEQFTAFNRVACYVPQGSFPLVSTAIHTAAIAKSAGVKEIAMITSPKEEQLNIAVAYAAYNSGVTEIVFVGGAQGIAALAYGTQTINRADFICGPGNSYVATAKRQVYGDVGIDMVAGPSEVFVIADSQADPYSVACDLVAQAEHGSGFEMSVLLSDSTELVKAVASELKSIKSSIKENPGFLQVWDNSLYLASVESIDDAIKITNISAPEHVEIMTVDAQNDSTKIINAGAVFVGKYSAEPIGDFVAGPSHVLPTNSSARFTSGLSAASFFRRTSIMEIDEKSYEKLAPLSETFGEMEGLAGHAMSSVARMKKEK